MKSFAVVVLLIWSVNLFGVTDAQAKDRFYMEIGGGGALLFGASGLFGQPTQTFSGPGFSGRLNFVFVVAPQEDAFALHLGAEYRFLSVGDGDNQLSIQAPYPFLRLETFKRFFISIGVAPFLFIRNAPGFGFDGLTMPGGAVGFTTDLGYNFRITPAASIVLTAGAHTAFYNGTFSPLPGLDVSALFRFYFDGGSSFNSPEEAQSRRGYKYEGYRYPYGREKR